VTGEKENLEVLDRSFWKKKTSWRKKKENASTSENWRKVGVDAETADIHSVCARSAAGKRTRAVLRRSASVAGTILRSCRTGRSIPATCAAARYDAHKQTLACVYDNRARRARASGLKRAPTWQAETELKHKATWQLKTSPSDTSDTNPTWQTVTEAQVTQVIQIRRGRP
jgi:hypothetical protein